MCRITTYGATVNRLAVLLCLCLAACGNPSAQTSNAARPFVEDTVNRVLTALAERDFESLASFVEQEGLIVSPYVMLDKDDVRLSRAEVEHCGSNPQKRLWGYRDGSGAPIELSCRQYFDEFVWDADYRKADEVLYDEPRQRGLDPNNNHDFAPGAIVVELHLRETPEGVNPYTPWKSLRLLLRLQSRGISLIAITRDVRTI